MLDRKDGMVTVEDGIRRLRLLDAKGKVWTQEMLLQVEEKAVSLVDLETKVRPELWMWSWNQQENEGACPVWSVFCFSERVGELPHHIHPALRGRDERLQLRLHPGSGV